MGTVQQQKVQDLRGDQTFFQASSDDDQIKSVRLDVSHVVKRYHLHVYREKFSLAGVAEKSVCKPFNSRKLLTLLLTTVSRRCNHLRHASVPSRCLVQASDALPLSYSGCKRHHLPFSLGF